MLGAALLGAPFLEMAGFYLMAPPLLGRLAQAPRQRSTLPALVWLAHLVVSVVLLLNGFACLGFDAKSGPPVLGIGLVAVMVIKELGYLLYWVVQTDPEHLAGARRRFAVKRKVSPASQLLGGLLLVPFAALGFTGFWGLLIARSPIHWSRPGDAIVELGLVVFIFFVVFAAVRSIYLIEEWAFLRGRGPALVWAGTILLNLLLALAGLLRA